MLPQDMLLVVQDYDATSSTISLSAYFDSNDGGPKFESEQIQKDARQKNKNYYFYM